MSGDNIDLNKEDIENFLSLECRINVRAENIMNRYQAHFKGSKCSFEGTEVYEGSVEIKWSERWAYGGYDSGFITVPIDDFLGDWKKWVDNEIQKDYDKNQQLNQLMREQREKAERHLFERLAEKYKNAGN